ncbi:MAG: DUF4351 domain-containing protein [Nostoc sp. ChiSLP01]|nr:DUF4351 domain-containing protein [Nostoc sp. CmiSLP01]
MQSTFKSGGALWLTESTEQLEALGEAFLDFTSVDDLVTWLEQLQ